MYDVGWLARADLHKLNCIINLKIPPSCLIVWDRVKDEALHQTTSTLTIKDLEPISQDLLLCRIYYRLK